MPQGITSTHRCQSSSMLLSGFYKLHRTCRSRQSSGQIVKLHGERFLSGNQLQLSCQPWNSLWTKTCFFCSWSTFDIYLCLYSNQFKYLRSPLEHFCSDRTNHRVKLEAWSILQPLGKKEWLTSNIMVEETLLSDPLGWNYRRMRQGRNEGATDSLYLWHYSLLPRYKFHLVLSLAAESLSGRPICTIDFTYTPEEWKQGILAEVIHGSPWKGKQRRRWVSAGFWPMDREIDTEIISFKR